LHIIAYPGEIPVFNGAAVASGWLPRAMTFATSPMLSSGHGRERDQLLHRSKRQGSADLFPYDVGKYPDQAWSGPSSLRQVTTKAEVMPGKFYVETSNDRLYLHQSDVDSGEAIEVSDQDDLSKLALMM
jgi:hypothetical protein